MLNNLLNTLSFGAAIKSGGKKYSVVMRLADRLFVVVDPAQKLPAPLLLAEADIQMDPASAGPAKVVPGPKPSPEPEINPGPKEIPSDK